MKVEDGPKYILWEMLAKHGKRVTCQKDEASGRWKLQLSEADLGPDGLMAWYITEIDTISDVASDHSLTLSGMGKREKLYFRDGIDLIPCALAQDFARVLLADLYAQTLNALQKSMVAMANAYGMNRDWLDMERIDHG